MIIRFRGSTHDHLGALARRGKSGGLAVERHLFPVGGPLHRDLLHGPENGVPPFVRSQQVQAALTGQLDVHTQAVGQKAQLFQQLRAGAGNGLGVDVAAETVLPPQQAQNRQHPLGGIVRAHQHGTGKEQALDVVAAVEFNGQLGQLPGGEGGPGHIVGLAVDAVTAIEGAAVGHQHLQQADTAAIGSKGVAAARGVTAADPARSCCPGSTAGGTGHIIFCAVRQDRQLIHQALFHGTPPKNGYKKESHTGWLFFFRRWWGVFTTSPWSPPHGLQCAGG